jgi:hypothetical protein
MSKAREILRAVEGTSSNASSTQALHQLCTHAFILMRKVRERHKDAAENTKSERQA